MPILREGVSGKKSVPQPTTIPSITPFGSGLSGPSFSPPSVTIAPPSVPPTAGVSGNITQPSFAPPAPITSPAPAAAPGGFAGAPGAPGAAPAPAGAAAPAAPQIQVGQFNETEIDAALRAIEAQFNMSREELLADQSIIGSQYRFLTTQLERARAQALEQTEAGALQRGIFRSGIFAEDAAQQEALFAEQQAQAASQQQAQMAAINAALAQLPAASQAQQAAEEERIRREQAQAMLAAGLVPPTAAQDRGAGYPYSPGVTPPGVTPLPQIV